MKAKELLFNLIPFKDIIGRCLITKFFEKPIFVVGCGRSGTTALVYALGCHPNIDCSPNEAVISLPISSIAYDYCCGKNHNWHVSGINIDSDIYRNTLKKLFYESIWGINFGLRRNLGVFRNSLSRIKHTEFWGTKAFPTENGYHGMEWMFPGSQYIYIVRNGIDVVSSMRKFDGFSNKNFKECCEFWVITVNRYDYLRTKDNAITIRFEEFLNNSELVLKNIQIKFGINYSSEPSKFASSTTVHPEDKLTQKVNPLSIFNKRPIAWKSWNNEEKKIFKEVCSNAMKKLNYDLPF